MVSLPLPLLFFLLCLASTTADYGLDYSFPITDWKVKEDGPFVGKQAMYDKYLLGCRENNPPKFEGDASDLCAVYEFDRLAMNKDQPKSMVNFTSAGYAKIKAPKEAVKLLTEFWNEHKNEQQPEDWDSPNTYVNHWEHSSFFLPIPDDSDSDGYSMMEKIYDLVYPILSSWVGGLELTETSLYGIRVYKAGAVLAPHVDRLPLVTSAIINVAQDVNEPWPLEVYGHDGIARNITIEPGEMILYESHSIVHGRPFPLLGNENSFVANVFIHFEPLGYTERHEHSASRKSDAETAKIMYEEAINNQKSPRAALPTRNDDLPAYIAKGSIEETMWRQSYVYKPDVKKPKIEKKAKVINEVEGVTPHIAAATGKLKILKKMHGRDPNLLHEKDSNDWTPMHEAARAGQKEVLEFLVKNGGSVNERTNKGKGGTPLWWAQQEFGENHPAVRFLRDMGALNFGPEL